MDANLMSDETPVRSGLELDAPGSLESLRADPDLGSQASIERQLLVFRRIAAPLMAVVAGWSGREQEANSLNQSAVQFAELIDSTISLNHHISGTLRLDETASDSRWLAAASAAEIVAAHYRATSRALSQDEATDVVTALKGAVLKSLDGLAMPTGTQDENASLLGRSLKALAPSASAIARFSFGRDPMELLAEVARRLTAIATDVAGKLGRSEAGGGGAGSPLYYAVLEVAGEFYMESHFTEMDRLLEMAPEERKEYVQAHNRKIPMEPVWERLGLRMGMLEALTAYLPGADGPPQTNAGGA